MRLPVVYDYRTRRQRNTHGCVAPGGEGYIRRVHLFFSLGDNPAHDRRDGHRTNVIAMVGGDHDTAERVRKKR